MASEEFSDYTLLEASQENPAAMLAARQSVATATFLRERHTDSLPRSVQSEEMRAAPAEMRGPAGVHLLRETPYRTAIESNSPYGAAIENNSSVQFSSVQFSSVQPFRHKG